MFQNLSRSAAPIAVIGFAMTLSACGPATINQADVEEQAELALTQEVGIEAPPITCPGDLEATVGTEMTCILSDGETSYEVYITVTTIEGGTANFDVEVAQTPIP